MEVTFLDTGYADAILIQSPDGKNVLLDAGDVTKPELVAEFLKSKGVDSLDLVIISHPHKNHFGALFRVLDEIPIKEVLWNGGPRQDDPFPDLVKRIEEKKIPMGVVRAGSKITKGPLIFTVLHPAGELVHNINSNSLVLKMIYGEISILFTTDITGDVQENLIKKFGKELVSDLVQVPHHGGPISNAFIDFFEPQFFVISTGPNEWLIPDEDQVAKLKGEVLRTDKHGDLIFRSDGKTLRRIT